MTTSPVAVRLRAEGRDDPIGLGEPRPRLNWRFELAPPATRQSSVAMEVATAISLRWGRHHVEVAG